MGGKDNYSSAKSNVSSSFSIGRLTSILVIIFIFIFFAIESNLYKRITESNIREVSANNYLRDQPLSSASGKLTYYPNGISSYYIKRVFR